MATFQGRNFSFPLGRRTLVMGILNLTPDSFSDGGLYKDAPSALKRAREIAAEGADLLDVGAESTRPGHVPLSPEEELRRLLPVLEALGDFPIPVSVDTYHPSVARAALAKGAAIVNDVSGVLSPEMAAVVREAGAGWIVMHTGGGDASHPAEYPDGDVVRAVRLFFEESGELARALGIPDAALCLDPGIGFGKTNEQNLRLLREVAAYRPKDRALLVGASRKRVVGTACGEADPQKRLAGTLAAHTAAIAGGADLLRVHDVAASVQAARVADAIYR
jgi:dihydropteroate synthase